jgi:multiple sugar transport system substrate-binding protein
MHRLATARAVAVIALVLAGCTASPATPTAGGDTIVWLANSLTQSPNDPRVALIDAFERAHPSITVELKPAPTSTNAYHATLVDQLTTGATTPDVYLGDVVWPPPPRPSAWRSAPTVARSRSRPATASRCGIR